MKQANLFLLRKIALIFLLSIGISATGIAQTCEPPKIIFNAESGNLFSPEQEMIFGELVIQNQLGEMRFVHNPQLLAYLEEIAARIEKHLPPTGLKFQLHIVDTRDVNAFNIPGGHIMISRKMIAFVANEDELAGVIAHEFGHAVVRHAAKDMSESLRKILNIKALGDRKDVTEKYNLLIERARTKSVSRKKGHEDKEQLEADKIGLFAMASAGYDPDAMSSSFDRIYEARGNIGNWFSDLFGGLPPELKRIRELVLSAKKMPPACRNTRDARATEEFLKWQADVVTFREATRQEVLPGLLWKKELAPKLRSDISNLKFSKEGKYLLAQDDFAITIIERESLQVAFQIPVESAHKATFTPDGKYVTFITRNLSYEKWSLAEKKPVEVHELTLRKGCWEYQLSPDGNHLACVDTSLNVNIIETKTGIKIWEKKEFYQLNYFEVLIWAFAIRDRDALTSSFFRIEFSPDSRYVMISRSNKYRFGLPMIGAASENGALAIDLTNLKPVQVGKNIKKLSERSYFFLNSEMIVGMSSIKVEESGVFSFPEGKQLEKFALHGQDLEATANSNYLLIKPLSNAKLGVFDLKNKIIITAMNKVDAALWNNIMAFESISAKIRIQEISYNEAKKNIDSKILGDIEIPTTPIKNLETAELSNNFKWILFSSKTRGGLWNLESGERKHYVRGFDGGIIDDAGMAIVDFPKQDETPHSLVLLKQDKDNNAQLFARLDKGTRQYGRFLLKRKSLKEPETKAANNTTPEDKTKKTPDNKTEDDELDNLPLHHNVKFELIDIINNKALWSQDFEKEAPGFSFDQFSGRMILFWSLYSDVGKAKLKESVELQNKVTAMGDKFNGYLVEIIDSFEQKVVGKILVDTGNGSFGIRNGSSERDWLLLYDTKGRVLIYSIKDGELRHRFFGNHAAINPIQDQIVVENFPGEITLFDLKSGDSQNKFIINGDAGFIRFNLEGNKLLILNNHQTAYCFDLTKLSNN